MDSKLYIKISEIEHWQKVQKGDTDSFKLLYIEYSNILYNYGYKISQDEALIKDAIQHVFEVLWKKRNDIELKTSFKYYILTIFRRELVSKIQYQHKAVSQFPEMEFELSIESKIILDETQQQLRRDMDQAISTLTARQKEILFLKYYENMSYEEISKLMSLNQNSMYKLLSAAIKRLKKHFISVFLSVCLICGVFL